MMTKIAVAAALALAFVTAQGAEAIKPLRGETSVGFQCRSAHIPEARQCAQACEKASSADARWECVHACTTESLWSMSQCRAQGGPAASSFAVR
jgi:hypothetical protein